jgi:hypothetical protein
VPGISFFFFSLYILSQNLMKRIYVRCNADLQKVALNMSSGIGRYTCKGDLISRNGPHLE